MYLQQIPNEKCVKIIRRNLIKTLHSFYLQKNIADQHIPLLSAQSSIPIGIDKLKHGIYMLDFYFTAIKCWGVHVRQWSQTDDTVIAQIYHLGVLFKVLQVFFPARCFMCFLCLFPRSIEEGESIFRMAQILILYNNLLIFQGDHFL